MPRDISIVGSTLLTKIEIVREKVRLGETHEEILEYFLNVCKVSISGITLKRFIKDHEITQFDNISEEELRDIVSTYFVDTPSTDNRGVSDFSYSVKVV